jgi:hypothetical protein
MTGENEPGAERTEESASQPERPSPRGLLRLPALVVIALYMFLLAGMNVVSVAKGLARPSSLILSAAFFTAAMGLLLLFRWAWALTLAAFVFRSGFFLWQFSTQHDMGSVMQGGLNLVIFLYLVRPEVRASLR